MNTHKGLKFQSPYVREDLLEMSYKLAKGLPLFITTVGGIVDGDDDVLYIESDELGNAVLFSFENKVVASTFMALKSKKVRGGTPKITRIMAEDLIKKCADLMKETKQIGTLKVVICRNKDGVVAPIDELWSSVKN